MKHGVFGNVPGHVVVTGCRGTKFGQIGFKCDKLYNLGLLKISFHFGSLRPVSIHFDSVSQNVQKMSLKSPRFEAN